MEVSFPSHKEKPQLVFVTGGPGSGKGTQAAKLVRDLKYVHLSVGDLMRAEAASKTKDGQEIEKIVSSGGLVPDSLTVNILLRAIKTRNAKKYLIDGFPRNLEQAHLFEKAYKEIDFILNFDAPDEVLLERLLKRALTDGRRDDNEEAIANRLKIYHSQSTVAINYYARYGKVVSVDAQGTEDDIYKRTLQALVPNLLFFYGPPACGQEKLAERLSALAGYSLIKAKEYFKKNGLTNATDEVKMDHLISHLRDHPLRNFILHEFPENNRQVKIFVDHFAAPRRFYYFDYSRDQFENHIVNKPKAERQQLLQEYDNYVRNRKDIIKYFTGKPYFVRVQEDESEVRLWKNVVSTLAPEIIVSPDLPRNDFAANYINRIIHERGYVYLNIQELVNDEIHRDTQLGKLLKQAGGVGYEADVLRVDLVKRCIFQNPDRRKFLLGGFPHNLSALRYFEDNASDVKAILAFTDETIRLEEDSIYNFAHIKGKLIKANTEHLDQFDNHVQNRCKYGFVIGTESAGRPAIATYLKGKFATQLVNWEQTNEYLKQKLSTEENTVDEVPFPELVKHFKNEIDSKDRTENILFDHWPFEKEQLAQFLRTVGAPSYVLWLNASEETLGKRWVIENKAEAVDEGEQEKINEDVGKVRQLIQVIQDFLAEKEKGSVDLFDIKVGLSAESTLKDLNSIIFKKVFIYRNLLPAHKGNTVKEYVVNLCLNKDVTFIDVPDLIQESLNGNDELAKKLRSQIIMSGTTDETVTPSRLTPTLVTELINRRLKSYPSSKYLMLYNYPNADTKDDDFYPRAADELHQIELDVGPVKQVIVVSEKEVDFTINDPIEEKPVQEEVVVVKPVRAEGEEGEEGEPEEPPKEEEEELDENGEPKKKFNPLEFNWSLSNGIPKSLAQIYNRRFKTEYQQYDLSSVQVFDAIIGGSIKLFDEGEDHGRDFFVLVKSD